MLLYHYEKKGLWILTTLIVVLLVLPRQFSEGRDAFFLLEAIVLPDTNFPQTATEEQAVLELNRADSLALLRIKGIGPYYAHRILAYRERLGGFYEVGQLKELKMTYFNADSSASLLTADPALIRKKDFQTLTFKEILKHPYLAYEDVVLIFQAKKKYGTVAYDTLHRHRVLPAHKLRKIKPYFR